MLVSITITYALFLLAGIIRGSVAKRKMDDILDTCFDEELFNVPLRRSKRKREKRIESRNPWKYAETLIPIYEIIRWIKMRLWSLTAELVMK